MDEIQLPPGARAVLLGPDVVARALAGRQSDPQRCWLLRRPRGVRRSFVTEVVEDGGHAERWMLLQDAETRGSYVDEVLLAAAEPDHRAAWLLRQPDEVRRSYVDAVIDAP